MNIKYRTVRGYEGTNVREYEGTSSMRSAKHPKGTRMGNAESLMAWELARDPWMDISPNH